MILTPLAISGAWLVESPVWSDDRGFFREWFKKDQILNATGLDFDVSQANFSVSNKNVIRGIHYSLASEGQAKLITCVSGSIMDVVVDLRPDSSSFKTVEHIDLEQGDGKAVLVGKGLGHGFLSKVDNSGVAYLLSSSYAPDFEYDISPLDSELDIKWHLTSTNEQNFTLSEKDRLAPTLKARLEQRELPLLN
jgi:dTDP-4-dehydrorhamnose 3,5-epimerase